MDPTFGCLLNLCMIALEKINCIVSHYSKGGCKQLKNKKENEARLLLLLFKKKKQQQYKRNTFKVLKQVIPAIDLRAQKIPLNFFAVSKYCVCCQNTYIYFKFTNILVSLKFPTQWRLNYSIKWWVFVQILLWRKIYMSSWEYTLEHIHCILLSGYFLHSSLWKKW